MSIGEALLAERSRSERLRRRAAPHWDELRPAEKARVHVYRLLIALVVAFLAVAGLVAGLGA